LDHLTATITDNDLLALLGRVVETEPTPESTSRLRLRFFQTEFSWQALVDLAVAQEVLPAFIFALNQRCLLPPTPSTLSEDARVAHTATRLAAAYQQHLDRQMDLREQLVAVLTALNREGIIPVLLKGAVHLTIVHPKWHEARSMRDLDILVRPSEALRASQLLVSMGYESESEQTLAPFDRHLPELHLPNRAGCVELHTEALSFTARPALKTDEIWMRAELRNFAGTSVRVLPPEWHLLHGMLHHQISDHGHAMRLLAIKGLWEFAMVGSELSPEAWEAIIAQARDRGCIDVMTSWVVQANRLFGLRIPDTLVVSDDASKHAEATFRRAQAPFGIRWALLTAQKLRFGFSPTALAARYKLAESDSLARAALRHLIFLVRRHGGRV
jgi:hypothetical protein